MTGEQGALPFNDTHRADVDQLTVFDGIEENENDGGQPEQVGATRTSPGTPVLSAEDQAYVDRIDAKNAAARARHAAKHQRVTPSGATS